MDFHALNLALLAMVNWRELFPNGRRRGNEIQCGDKYGNPGDSFCWNQITGEYFDFATGERGRDLIALHAARWGCGMGEAAERLKVEYGLLDPGADQAGAKNGITTRREPSFPRGNSSHSAAPSPGAAFKAIPSPPDPPTEADFTMNGRYPKPDLISPYERPGKRWGEWFVAFFIRRWNAARGRRKLILPLSYGILDGVEGWHNRLPPGPRPLLGLREIESARSFGDRRPVLIVEGEKCFEAAKSFYINDFLPLTWHGGSQAAKLSDWRTLDGAGPFILWPDADKAGRDAMDEVSKILLEYRKNKVSILPIPADKPAGWDCADFVEEEKRNDHAIAC
ncbi:MAG: hypothetical protein LBS31_10960 [Candidatus Adiutrix sp.]|jgi:hypothetical protein|nr:hypothetical protein [Candidatus Adiutrix sp.]